MEMDLCKDDSDKKIEDFIKNLTIPIINLMAKFSSLSNTQMYLLLKK